MAVIEARPPSRLRRALPWLIGLAILIAVITRVPVAAFRDAMGQGPHLLLAIVNIGINVAVLGTDSVATWFTLVAVRMRRPFAHVVAVRGATFVLFVINYAVGQGGFGYYLHKTGERPQRAVGATLFLIGTNLAMLLVLTTAAWCWDRSAVGTGDTAAASLWWTLVGLCGAFVVYLAVIAAAPGWLARRPWLAPLFEAGLRGHALAMASRLPHVIVLVVGHWVAMRAWGIEVPFAVGMTLMPAVVIASALPLSPAGLGTTQAAFVLFFRDYAHGATADERTATVLAFAIVHFVYGVAASLAVGAACLPFARKLGVVPSKRAPAGEAPVDPSDASDASDAADAANAPDAPTKPS